MPRVLVCAATRAEHDACDRGLRDAPGEGYEMLLTGVGPSRAGESLVRRLSRGPRPDLVVSSGFAGAVSTTVPLSSWITGIRISEWDGIAEVPVEGVALVEGPPGLVRCHVLSSSEVSFGSAKIASGGSRSLVVDMESAALAHEAGRRGVAFAIIRMISDTPAHPLPAFVSPFAAALAAGAFASRVGLGARALCGAIGDPRGVARLVTESAGWLRDLEAGWRALARSPLV